MTSEQRAALRRHVLSSALAGDTATPRASVVSNVESLAAADPDKALGIGARGRDAPSIMAAVAALCGCSPSLEEREGPGVIDPDRLLDGLELLGARMARAAQDGERVLVCTGHPTGLLVMYQAVARALVAAGVRLEAPMESEPLTPPGDEGRGRRIRYLDGVGVLATGGDLLHSHDSWPMDALLDRIERPDLVLADHGFAGAAIARGLDVACFTDVNDPAIAVAWADGLTKIVVPLDDNREPRLYEPLAAFLVGHVAH